MSCKPPHRRFQFRLRTLMIAVTLIAALSAWICSNLNWIRRRHESVGDKEPIWRLPNFKGGAPGTLWLFGETGMATIHCVMTNPEKLDQEVNETKRLFPEAKVDGELQGPS